MRHEELSGDVAWPHSHHGQLDDPPPDVIGKGTAIDEDAAQLVDAGLTCVEEKVSFMASIFCKDFWKVTCMGHIV